VGLGNRWGGKRKEKGNTKTRREKPTEGCRGGKSHSSTKGGKRGTLGEEVFASFRPLKVKGEGKTEKLVRRFYLRKEGKDARLPLFRGVRKEGDTRRKVARLEEKGKKRLWEGGEK